jgi:hypothetical protein
MIDYKKYFDAGIEFDKYFEAMQGPISAETTEKHAQFIPLNIQRSKRILKTFQADAELEKIIKLLPPQNWLVISEHWCGDAAQIVPALYKLSTLNSQMNFRTIYRDENLPLIDLHLTGGTRSIPKLLILDTNFDLIATYGPRPAAAQNLVLKLKADAATADTYAEALHAWYAKNKSAELQKELIHLFKEIIQLQVN